MVNELISQETHLKGCSWTPGHLPPGLRDRTVQWFLRVISRALSTERLMGPVLIVSQVYMESRRSICLVLLEIQDFLLPYCLGAFFAYFTKMSNVASISGM